ncbi:MAG: hypothetical protein IPM69_09140 [Ignavibacteria bacterium]|nr:hypothetical protein [Ignavibacteria bacterium]
MDTASKEVNSPRDSDESYGDTSLLSPECTVIISDGIIIQANDAAWNILGATSEKRAHRKEYYTFHSS